jgi:hypothetical protein
MKKILLLLLLISGKMLGQETDIRSWTGVSLEKKLNKHISLNANLQVRTTDNFTAVGSYVGEFGLGYKLNKHWEVSAYYRFSKSKNGTKVKMPISTNLFIDFMPILIMIEKYRY